MLSPTTVSIFLLLAFGCQAFHKPSFLTLRGGASTSTSSNSTSSDVPIQYGRIHDDLFRLTPEQIETFHREGCVTIENVLTEEEVDELQAIFDRFISGEIEVPGKDFCDMSKP